MKDILPVVKFYSTITSYNGQSVAIFVAGDNDIGGEGGDRVTKEKVSRFKKHFPSKFLSGDIVSSKTMGNFVRRYSMTILQADNFEDLRKIDFLHSFL